MNSKLSEFKLTPVTGSFKKGIFPGRRISNLYELSEAVAFLELAAYPDGYEGEVNKMLSVIISCVRDLNNDEIKMIMNMQLSSQNDNYECDELNIDMQKMIFNKLGDNSKWPMPKNAVTATLEVKSSSIKTLTEIVTFMKEQSGAASNSKNKITDSEAIEQLEDDLRAYEVFGDIGCSNLITRNAGGKTVAGTLITGIMRYRNMGVSDGEIKTKLSSIGRNVSKLLDRAFRLADELKDGNDSSSTIKSQEKNISVLVWLSVVCILGFYENDGTTKHTEDHMKDELTAFCDIMRKCIIKDRNKRRLIIDACGHDFTKKVWSVARRSLTLNCCSLVLSESRMVQTCVITGLGPALSNIRNVKADVGFVNFLCQMWMLIEKLPEVPKLNKDDFRLQTASLLQHSLINSCNCFGFSIMMAGSTNNIIVTSKN